MKLFWCRFTIFSILWIFVLIMDSKQVAVSIILFALSMGIYFLLSIHKFLLILYLSLVSILFVHGILNTNDAMLSVIVILYILIDASFRLKEKQLVRYSVVTMVLAFILLFIRDEVSLERLIMIGCLDFLIITISRMTEERREQAEIYEQLRGEYRNLKRMNLTTENNARLEERTKIARDIHDSVGHRLTALIMKLEILTIQDTHNSYSELKEMAKESLEETRQAVKALQTEENEGIATIVHLIRKLEAESHILVQFTMKQGVLSVPMSNDKSVALYRVIQESLTNAMRHAGSREIQVILGKTATGDISFEITNTVFDPIPFTYGFGLTNMKQRIDGVKGTLTIYQTVNEFVVAGSIPSEEE
ncbi:sensor histidine kinase [Oceanobacillus sp. 143]|uniref:histidine kinase n=1 Tax=Oceanobacillus zhaokaii TaxID=2052660 RepID=A0A345PF59_9BACI|nr:histidine kinase [Oceanobacillus zhaokaii]AXI08639.1 sensor histidine kinase [Oceanobacillus zhaokaii]QGS68418.1 sensor histidine kinase [Oceanobacillus sp. 143]